MIFNLKTLNFHLQNTNKEIANISIPVEEPLRNGRFNFIVPVYLISKYIHLAIFFSPSLQLLHISQCNDEKFISKAETDTTFHEGGFTCNAHAEYKCENCMKLSNSSPYFYLVRVLHQTREECVNEKVLSVGIVFNSFLFNPMSSGHFI